ncbi:hypothetical protein NM688_g4682 [Phlebia brevispora]|uniref:Uncharacterized protein n=1 Tax=Phlebia brevispora TaxID=194682 RepID=A0ACC1T1Z1_9APHY|nr:hypothetical protein NM688_g4682 [Phlebia brevispora]
MSISGVGGRRVGGRPLGTIDEKVHSTVLPAIPVHLVELSRARIGQVAAKRKLMLESSISPFTVYGESARRTIALAMARISSLPSCYNPSSLSSYATDYPTHFLASAVCIVPSTLYQKDAGFQQNPPTRTPPQYDFVNNPSFRRTIAE